MSIMYEKFPETANSVLFFDKRAGVLIQRRLKDKETPFSIEKAGLTQ